MTRTTPLAGEHRNAGARMTAFAGWELPLSFRSEHEEHRAVREAAGLFDVSHMMVTDVSGPSAQDWLRRLLCSDVAGLREPGHGRYSALLNPSGGVIDDAIVFRHPANAGQGYRYRLVTNAGTRERVHDWFAAQAQAGVELHERSDLAMLAVQGPQALRLCEAVLAEMFADVFPSIGLKRLRRFEACSGTASAADVFVSRTGYTGEDGVEICVAADRAPALWRRLVAAGAEPCGLAVRDVLRLEAGMNLSGSDMDETVRPDEAGLAWLVDLKDPARAFIGRDALEGAAPRFQRRGLLLLDKGIARAGCRILRAEGDDDAAVLGEVTSGTFSLSLDRGIALARLRTDVPDLPAEACEVRVEVRRRRLRARLAEPPFVKPGGGST